MRVLAFACLLIAAAAPVAAQGITVALTPGSSQVAPGAEFTLELTVTQAGAAFNAFDAFVVYDPSALTLLPLSPTSLQQGLLMTGACGNTFHIFRQGSSTDSVTCVLLCNGVSVTGPGQIYTLKFRASMTPQVTTVQFLPGLAFYNAGLRISPIHTSSAVVGIGMSPVSVEPQAPPARIELRVAPNPSLGSAVFTIESEAVGPQRITVWDVAGRLVRRFDRAGSAAGGRVISWDGRDAEGREAPAGIYFVSLEVSNRRISRTLTLVR